MKLHPLDRSNYFKGLLLLIGKDNKISQNESELLKKVGAKLGFDKKFCEDAIRDFFINEHIVDEPPKFNDPGLAESFIKDGITLIYDSQIEKEELTYLKDIASTNGIDKNRLDALTRSIIESRYGTNSHLEIEKYI